MNIYERPNLGNCTLKTAISMSNTRQRRSSRTTYFKHESYKNLETLVNPKKQFIIYETSLLQL